MRANLFAPPSLVSPQEEEQYTAIVDAILSTADLETISRKRIRQGLEKALGGKDLSGKKVILPHPVRHFILPEALRTQV